MSWKKDPNKDKRQVIRLARVFDLQADFDDDDPLVVALTYTLPALEISHPTHEIVF